jgi:DNA-binding IclR family transcriptional regulator
MAKTLLRGLDLLEEVGLHGPLTVTELARRIGVHVTIVSRTVSACEPEGWLDRVDGKITVGPRCALLGLSSPASQAVHQAGPLIRAIAGVTGVAAAASGLVGRDVMVLTSAGNRTSDLPDGISSRLPVHAMAAGRAIAAQLSPKHLEAVLPSEPYPGREELMASLAGSTPIPAYLADYQPADTPPSGLTTTREELMTELETIRTTGFARDRGELHPSVHCIATPWSTPTLPASLACIGTREEIANNRPMIEACLRAAAEPGASPRDIAHAAASSSLS